MLASLIAVLMTLTGAPATAQGMRSNDYWLSYTSKLPIGSTLRVRTTDGRRLTALLAIVDTTGITLEPKTRIPEPPRHIPFERLEQVELKQNGGSAGKAAAIGVAAGVGSFFALLAIIAAGWD